MPLDICSNELERRQINMQYTELLILWLNDRPQNVSVEGKLSLNVLLREVWP